MSEVMKYEDGDPCAGMYASSDGVWVHIDDYDRLSGENDRLRLLVTEFISQIESYGQDELYTKANTWLRENKL